MPSKQNVSVSTGLAAYHYRRRNHYECSGESFRSVGEQSLVEITSRRFRRSAHITEYAFNASASNEPRNDTTWAT
jgi:hypothetical protein